MDTQIQRIVDNTIKELAYPTECKITRIYQDLKVDIQSDYGKLTYVDTIGTPTENTSKSILIFLDNDFKKPIVIIDNKNTE